MYLLFHKSESVSHLVMLDSWRPPWTEAHQAPLSLGFSRQEYWGGLPFPSPGEFSNPGIKPRSPTLQADSLPSESPGKHNSFINPPLMNNLLGKVHRHFQHPCNRPFLIGPWGGISCCVSKRALCTLPQAGLPHLLHFKTFSSLRRLPAPTEAFACPALSGEEALSLALPSLRSRSYLLLLEVVRPLSAAEASPAV